MPFRFSTASPRQSDNRGGQTARRSEVQRRFATAQPPLPLHHAVHSFSHHRLSPFSGAETSTGDLVVQDGMNAGKIFFRPLR